MSKKLHILFLSSWYPSRVTPTNGNFVQKHAEAIATKHKVTVVFAVGDINLNQQYEITNEVVNNVRNIIIYFKKHPNKLLNAYRKYSALKKAYSLVDRFDIIHGNILFPIGIFVWIQTTLKNKPYIFTEHWSGYLPENKSSLSFTESVITKFITRKADYIIPVSENLKNEMLNNNYKGNYKIIGNIVDVDIFHPVNNNNSTFNIVHISSFDEDSKNISGLLSTIKNISKTRTDFVFNIIGDGNINELKLKMNELQIPSKLINIEGAKTPKGIAKTLQQANLYISFSNYETFGIVMAEALACGVPVISTNTGVLTELESSNYITIINKNDKNALLQAILKHLNSDSKFDTYKMNNQIKQLFGIESIVNQYTQVYKNAITSHLKLN